MHAKTVMITQGDDSLLQDTKNEHSNEYVILNDFIPTLLSEQQ